MKSTGKGKVMPLLLVEGYIGQDEKLDYQPFIDAVNQIAAAGHKKAKMRINCGGGSIISAFAMFDYARESGIEWEVHVIGMAASMGGVLSQVARKGNRKISSNAFFMAHRAVGGVVGTADKMKSEAEALEKMEGRAIALYVEQTGKTEEEISAMFKSEKDTWLTAQEAVEWGFFDEVVEPENALLITDKPTSANIGEMVMKFQTPKPIMLKPELLAKLGLKEDASQTQIEAAMESKLNEIATMKADALKKEEQEATELLNNAVTAGMVAEAQKDAVMQVIKTNPGAAKTMLAAMKAPEQAPAAAAVPTMEALIKQFTPAAPGRENWTFQEWQRRDMPGLMKMKTEKPEQYKALLDATGLKISQQ